MNARKMTKQSFLILLTVLYPFMQFAALVDEIPINQYAVYSVMGLIVVVRLWQNSMICINQKARGVYIAIVGTMFFLPIMLLHVKTIEDAAYLLVLDGFIYVCDIMAQVDLEENHRVIYVWTGVLTAAVDAMIFLNIDQINANTITGIFFSSGVIRIRSEFGFSHANFAAIFIDSVLLLLYVCFKLSKKKILLLVIGFNIVGVMCTGSRTACLCVVAFTLLEVFFKIIKSIKNQRIRAAITSFGLLCFVAAGAFSTIDVTQLSTITSGRIGTILDGVNALKNSGHLLLGYTVSTVSDATDTLEQIGAIGSDNWYYMQIARFGVIGTAAFLVAILIVVKNLYEAVSRNNCDSYCLSAFTVLLLYGMGENVVYNQGVILSALVWVLTIQGLYLGDNKVQYDSEVENLGLSEEQKLIRGIQKEEIL